MLTGKIVGLGKYLPPKVMTNDDLAQIVETNDQWIVERTGIRERRVADGIIDKPSTMACKAAMEALEDAGIKGEDVDLIVCASTTPDLVFPGLACMVGKEIGATEDCGCFDVNSACPGWLAAYNTVLSFIEAGNSKTALVIGSEALTNYVDWEDRGTCILFGDGAGAAVVVAGEGKKNEFIMRSSAKRGDCLHCENMKQPKRFEEEGFLASTNMFMNGREVFKFVALEVPKLINDLADKYGFTMDEIDYFVLHQANQRIIEAVAKRLDQPIEKFPMSIMFTGNTSTASIPMLLKDMKDQGMLEPGKKIVFASFGGGLTWNANYIEY